MHNGTGERISSNSQDVLWAPQYTVTSPAGATLPGPSSHRSQPSTSAAIPADDPKHVPTVHAAKKQRLQGHYLPAHVQQRQQQWQNFLRTHHAAAAAAPRSTHSLAATSFAVQSAPAGGMGGLDHTGYQITAAAAGSMFRHAGWQIPGVAAAIAGPLAGREAAAASTWPGSTTDLNTRQIPPNSAKSCRTTAAPRTQHQQASLPATATAALREAAATAAPAAGSGYTPLKNEQPPAGQPFQKQASAGIASAAPVAACGSLLSSPSAVTAARPAAAAIAAVAQHIQSQAPDSAVSPAAIGYGLGSPARVTAAALAASESDPVYDTPYTAMRAVWPEPCLLELLCQQAKCLVDYHLALPTAVAAAGHSSRGSSRFSGGSSSSGGGGSRGELYPGKKG